MATVEHGVTRRRRTVALAVAAAGLLLPACFWTQPGFGPENARHNPGERVLTAATVADLAPAWSVAVSDASASEPLISGGRVLLTATDHDGSSVRALALSTGATIWDRPIEEYEFNLGSPVTFSGDTLWVSHRDDTAAPCPVRLTEIDPDDGTVVSSEPVRYPYGGPVTSAGFAVSVESDTCLDLSGGPSTLVVRDVATGTTQWSAPLAGSAGVVISDGVIHATVGDQVLGFALAGCGTPVCAPAWTLAGRAGTRAVVDGRRFSVTHEAWTDGHGVRFETATLTVTAAETGAVLWTTSYSGGDPYAGMGAARIGSLAVADGTVYVAASRDPSTPGPAIATLDAFPVDGCGDSWCPPAWSGPLTGPPRSTLAVGGGVVYAGLGQSGDDSHIVAFDAAGCGAASCGPLASVPVQGAPDTLSLAQGTLVVTSSAIGSHLVTAFRAG